MLLFEVRLAGLPVVDDRSLQVTERASRGGRDGRGPPVPSHFVLEDKREA